MFFLFGFVPVESLNDLVEFIIQPFKAFSQFVIGEGTGKVGMTDRLKKELEFSVGLLGVTDQ
jgi:hypothetical protein